ncbi:type II toxin-antitoxin system HicA family toxin [uncultured Psychrobacter sp.]|uniref:type II toxin-antitoxin system HicA family toxin n=1 Tax=uncultured Psychrobacter sp. TaxID=259303 RepID=UPI00345AF60A
MQRKHQKTLKAIFSKPISGNIKWSDIEALFIALGAEVSERAGSRVAIVLDNEVQVYHRPHPQPTTDKGAVASVRKWLDSLGYSPIDDTEQTVPAINEDKE